MDPQVWALVQQIGTGILAPLAVALGVFASKQVQRWQAKSDLKTMKQNSVDAVGAIQQLYPNEAPEVKARLCLEWANHLNTVAGITSLEQTQTILNEASVFATKTPMPPMLTLDATLPPKVSG